MEINRRSHWQRYNPACCARVRTVPLCQLTRFTFHYMTIRATLNYPCARRSKSCAQLNYNAAQARPHLFCSIAACHRRHYSLQALRHIAHPPLQYRLSSAHVSEWHYNHSICVYIWVYVGCRRVWQVQPGFAVTLGGEWWCNGEERALECIGTVYFDRHHDMNL